MKRAMVSFINGCCGVVLGICSASAGEVPGALTSAAPALTNVGGRVVLAWAGESGSKGKAVWYATFAGQWTPEVEVPGALTTSAPALGFAAKHLYLATTPPGTDRIYYYSTEQLVFTANGEPLCDAGVCAHTHAAPALLGDGSTLYAAWTTPAGGIGYATLSHGSWYVFPTLIPHATTSPTAGPTLAVYQDHLYVAWVEPSGEAIAVTSATLPLTSSSWSHQTTQIKVPTKVAPALGVLTVHSSATKLTQELFLAWTTPQSTVDFARWDMSGAKWTRVPSPISLPSGALTDLNPVLDGFTSQTNQVCVSSNVIALAFKNGLHHRPVIFSQNLHGCP
jgi:hypothetical protein